MTEATQINNAVRRYLGPLGRWVRFESPVTPGAPDWYYRLRGVAGWLEAKLIPESRRCPPTFTREQLLWGEDEVKWGGRWYLLGLTPSRTWLLLNAIAARAWFEGSAGWTPTITARGAFPVEALYEVLSDVRR